MRVFNFWLSLSKKISRKGLYPFLAGEFAKIPANCEVLNVGAGGEIGKLLGSHARANGFARISVDIDEKRGPDLVGDICRIDLGENRFQAVVMGEVLEHLHAPQEAIHNVRKALKGDGSLILTVPFIFPLHDRPGDYYRFTRYGLEHLLRDFRQVEIRERTSWSEAMGILLARLLVENSPVTRLAGPAFLLLCLLCWPLLVLLGKLIRADFVTTGYLVKAQK